MTYEQYNKAVEALKPPSDLTIFEQLQWYQDEIKLLREGLLASDLRRVLQDQKHWQDKVNSSLD